jgi:hypothetical protein
LIPSARTLSPFVWRGPQRRVAGPLSRLAAEPVQLKLDPVARNGARGPTTSIHFRDLGVNLAEVGHGG